MTTNRIDELQAEINGLKVVLMASLLAGMRGAPAPPQACDLLHKLSGRIVGDFTLDGPLHAQNEEIRKLMYAFVDRLFSDVRQSL